MSGKRFNDRRPSGTYVAVPAAVRFWRSVRIDSPDKCWLWDGADDGRHGYGRFFPTGKRAVQAHRFAYEDSFGPLYEGAFILHACDNPACVNPYHLRPGSNEENMNDRQIRNRTARGERGGTAKLSLSEVQAIRTLRGVITARVLSQRFGVCESAISHVWNGRNWK